MAGERDRILNLAEYIRKQGVSVNIGVNKARGNKGFFKTNDKAFRIDVSKGLDDKEVLRVLVHEFAHYIFHKNCIETDFYKKYEEELIKLTVDSIPKSSIEPLFEKKTAIKENISKISKKIKVSYPNIKLSDKKNKLEKEINKTELKYLLKYDSVKVLKCFSTKIYSIKNLESDFMNINPVYADYIRLNSAKRFLARINSRISRLNRYYNTPTELFARSLEYFILRPDYMKNTTPDLYKYYESTSKSGLMRDIVNICTAS